LFPLSRSPGSPSASGAFFPSTSHSGIRPHRPAVSLAHTTFNSNFRSAQSRVSFSSAVSCNCRSFSAACSFSLSVITAASLSWKLLVTASTESTALAALLLLEFLFDPSSAPGPSLPFHQIAHVPVSTSDASLSDAGSGSPPCHINAAGQGRNFSSTAATR